MSHNNHSASGHILALEYTDQQKRHWVKSKINTGGLKCQLPNPKVIINVCNMSTQTYHRRAATFQICKSYLLLQVYILK